jgi:hypothetical protein
MHKKILMACMAIAAFAAFVVAPAASASPALTKSGVLLATGSSITGTNTGETVFTGAFNVRCTNADLAGTLTTNSGSSIKGEVPAGSASFTGTGTGGACTSALGPVHVLFISKTCLVWVIGADSVTISGCGVPIVFVVEVTGTGPCKYSTASVTGTYKTASAATVNLSEQKATKSEGGIFCPSEGKLDMDFDLSSGGTALTIS